MESFIFRGGDIDRAATVNKMRNAGVERGPVLAQGAASWSQMKTHLLVSTSEKSSQSCSLLEDCVTGDKCSL